VKPPVGLTLLVGGARSGKSALAVRLASGYDGPVVFVATAVVGDEDMAVRVGRHRAERPVHWSTIEHPTFGAGEVAAIDPAACIVVDCMTLWVNEQMMESPASSADISSAADDLSIVEAASALAASLASRRSPSLAISNEVGLGIVPVNALARRYRDVLGNVNRAVAEAATQSYFVSAGRLLPLLRPEEVFP
jgi:adenosylcobinamide kinase / adenosylcobinamide-phosphate guanylyltransferase